MTRLFTSFSTCILAAGMTLPSLADRVEVHVTGEVYFVTAWYGVFADVAVGEPVSMSFSVDSEDFVTSPGNPNLRGYPIDQEEFTMSVAGIDVGLLVQAPPVYLVVEYDPDYFGLIRLSRDLEAWAADPLIDHIGYFGFPLDLEHFLWMEEGVITSPDIIAAAGTYTQDENGFFIGGWGFDDVLWQHIDFAADTLVIDLVEPECFTDLDGDGVTGSVDLTYLLGAWGPNPGHAADFNDDGRVNAVDLTIMLGAWGACP